MGLTIPDKLAKKLIHALHVSTPTVGGFDTYQDCQFAQNLLVSLAETGWVLAKRDGTKLTVEQALELSQEEQRDVLLLSVKEFEDFDPADYN